MAVLNAIGQFLTILDRLQQAGDRGQAAWNGIKGVLEAHGIEADTEALDAVITNATRREAMARREAGTPDDVTGPVNTGSTGD
jgi:hypothetical protein